MGKLIVDLKKVSSTVMPEGTYPCRIVKVEAKVSAKSGEHYLNFELQVSDGPYVGQKAWMIVSLAESATFRVKQTFKALGLSEEYLNEMESLDVDSNNLLVNPCFDDMIVDVQFKQETYEGEVRAKPRKIIGVIEGVADLSRTSDAEEDLEEDIY